MCSRSRKGRNGGLHFFFACSQFVSQHRVYSLYASIISGTYVIFNLRNLISQCSYGGRLIQHGLVGPPPRSYCQVSSPHRLSPGLDQGLVLRYYFPFTYALSGGPDDFKTDIQVFGVLIRVKLLELPKARLTPP